MKTLKKRLIEGIASVYLVQGDDFYLFEKALAMIKSACKITMEDFNVNVFDEENFSAEKIITATEMMPVIDEKRVVVVKGGKVSEADKKLLLEKLLHIPKSTCVVFLDRSKTFDFLKRDFTFVDANRMDKEMVKKLTLALIAKEGKQISPEALSDLIDACNGYLSRIVSEVKKLSCFDPSSPIITSKMIDAVVTKDVEYSVFELTEALAKKDGDKALKLLKLMEKDSGVFSLISNHFRRLFYVAISDLSNAELASLLGVKEYAIVKARQLAKGFSKAQLKKICSFLEETDFFVKSGKILLSNALYLLVFNIIYV